jgi:hypothetical protein
MVTEAGEDKPYSERLFVGIHEHRGALMKAVVMETYGTPDVLELRDVAKPTRKAGEVLVRVHAASVNDWDWGLL